MNLRRVFALGLVLFAAASSALLAAEPITLPDLNPSEWFDGKMGGTFGAKTVTAFAKSNRVAVAGFRVVFVTHNEARAVVRASYLPGRDTGTARARRSSHITSVPNAAARRRPARWRVPG